MKTRTDFAAALGQRLSQRLGEPRYQLWFANKTNFSVEDGTLLVGVANLFQQDWLAKTFSADVEAAATELLARRTAVRFVIDPELFQAARARETAEPAAPTPAPAREAHSRAAARPARIRRWRRLDDFIVGACNRVAHASALSLVEAPDDHPCPLVLHGPVGTGKTHLLEGLCAALGQQHPDWRVCFVTAEEFTNRFVQAMHHGKIGSFRKQFRECDALIVDDVHFLARKQATQEEFLHTLDVLQNDQRPVILACDAHPRHNDHFAAELTDRLVGGAVWGLNLPDRATRLDLLHAKARRQRPLPDLVAAFLAEHLHGNVRELEGAVHSVLHLSRITGRPLDVELTREALGDLLRHSIRVVALADVERAVCEALGIPGDLLRSKKRGWAVSHPRMLAMYLARKHTNATYSEIGKHFGGRNHSTAVAAEKKVRQWLAEKGSLALGKRPASVQEFVDRAEHLLRK